ncbi:MULTISPECIES: hypothetical protein [Citricoccus]|uniref:Pyrroloquinoline-quinone binding quinoprotein n=1 Tax=Citricoccus parietis TaxID=592307 RepID=A0ABV6F0F6_9MICC|nr:hypothetical protein [Citricoccus sp. K5]VXC17127.1 conserved hypothetical protein [Citricoccus sp. K5]
MDETTETAFNLETVPAFPVLTLWLDEDTERTELNGVPVEPTPGEGYRQAAITAVVREVQRLHLEAVRVRVLSPTDEAWDMVVTATGDVLDATVTDLTADQPQRGPRRRWLLLGASTLAVLALGGLGTAVALSVTGDSAPQEWVVPGADQQIPVALPEAFSGRSAWSVPVAENSDVTALDAGHILSADPDGTLTARAPETGQPVWRGTSAPKDLTSAVHTDWAGTPSLAAQAGNELRVWDLRTPEDGSTVTATTIPVEQGWRVEVRGARPLVAKEHWIVGIPAAGHGLTDVVIPAGSRALTVTGDNQIITATETSLYTVNADGTVAGRTSFTPPAGASGAPQVSWMLDADHALLGWKTKDSSTAMTIIQVQDGATLATAEMAQAPDQRQQPIVETEGRAAAFDTLALTWGEEPMLRPLHSFETSTLDGTTAYGLADRADPASLDLSSLTSAPLPWETFTDEDPAPDLVDADAAYIVAETLENTVLYRSESAGTPADDPADDSKEK